MASASASNATITAQSSHPEYLPAVVQGTRALTINGRSSFAKYGLFLVTPKSQVSFTNESVHPPYILAEAMGEDTRCKPWGITSHPGLANILFKTLCFDIKPITDNVPYQSPSPYPEFLKYHANAIVEHLKSLPLNFGFIQLPLDHLDPISFLKDRPDFVGATGNGMIRAP